MMYASFFFFLSRKPSDEFMLYTSRPRYISCEVYLDLLAFLQKKVVGIAPIPPYTHVSILNRDTDDVSPKFYVCFMNQTATAAFMSWIHPFINLLLKTFHVSFSFCKKPTFIFLCKASASGVLQGSPSRTCLVIFFKVSGVQLLLIHKLKNDGHPLPLYTFFLHASLCT